MTETAIGTALSLLDFRNERKGEFVRLITEFETKIDRRLRALLLDLGYECRLRGWPKPMVVSLVRTPEENAAVGAKSQTHVDGRAADLRDRPDFSAAIVEYVNSWHGTGPQACAYRHDAGNGLHFHLQVPRAGVVGADQKET